MKYLSPKIDLEFLADQSFLNSSNDVTVDSETGGIILPPAPGGGFGA